MSDRCKRFSNLSRISRGKWQYLTTSDITRILQSYLKTCGRQHQTAALKKVALKTYDCGWNILKGNDSRKGNGKAAKSRKMMTLSP